MLSADGDASLDTDAVGGAVGFVALKDSTVLQASVSVANSSFDSCVSLCRRTAMSSDTLVSLAPHLRDSQCTLTAVGGAVGSVARGSSVEELTLSVSQSSFASCFGEEGVCIPRLIRCREQIAREGERERGREGERETQCGGKCAGVKVVGRSGEGAQACSVLCPALMLCDCSLQVVASAWTGPPRLPLQVPSSFRTASSMAVCLQEVCLMSVRLCSLCLC